MCFIQYMSTLDDSTVKQLVTAAYEEAENAYAPYSNYRVGAAALMKSGEVVRAHNIENASYGLSMCAERVCVYRALPGEIIAMAVATPDQDRAITPCGACLQVLAEFNPHMTVICSGTDLRIVKPLSEFLPHSFGFSG